MKRFIALSLALAFAASSQATMTGADPGAPEAVRPAAITDESPATTGYRCCWIYIGGMWVCYPCG